MLRQWSVHDISGAVRSAGPSSLLSRFDVWLPPLDSNFTEERRRGRALRNPQGRLRLCSTRLCPNRRRLPRREPGGYFPSTRPDRAGAFAPCQRERERVGPGREGSLFLPLSLSPTTLRSLSYSLLSRLLSLPIRPSFSSFVPSRRRSAHHARQVPRYRYPGALRRCLAHSGCVYFSSHLLFGPSTYLQCTSARP